MKKILAIIMTVCLLASALCITAFAASDVLTISALVKGKPVVIGSYTNFEDGWNDAMEIAGDEDEMKKNGYERIVVDLHTDWEANDDGEFTEEIWNGPGFDNDTIYVPADARVTLNLNGHTIDRGLTKDEDDGEVMFINDDADVIINNGTITGGYSNSEGGGLYIEGGANVTLNNVHIVNNRVHNDEGAGVYMYGGSKLTVNGGSFENNTADGNGRCGGAVCAKDSTAIFDNVVFKNNRSQYTGAAIYANNSDVTIKNCTFDGNDAQLSVVYADRSSINVSASTFVNNKGKEMFYLDYSTLTINSSEFKNNNHYNIISTNYSNTVQVTNSTFTGNDACMIYAASYGLDEGSYCRDCTFDENTYKDLVGVRPGSFVGNFTNMVFYDCDFGNSNFKYANNVTIENSKDSVTDAALSVTLLRNDGTQKTTYYKAFDFGWNSAVDAAKTNTYERVIVDLLADWNTNEYGVITIPENAKMTINMNGHTIDRGLGKSNQDDGEVIRVNNDADLVINGGKEGDAFVKPGENTANVPMGKITGGNSDNGAGGIHIHDEARVTLNNVNIVGNTTDDDDGAGIAAYDGAVLVMNGGSISNNILWSSFQSYADPYGSLYLNDSTAYLNSVEFVGNQFAGNNSAYGVAIYSANSKLVAENCTFRENGNRDAVSQGRIPSSVVCIDEGSMEFINCVFEDNGTSGINNGAEIVQLWGGTIKISNSVFRNNSCGSVIEVFSGTIEVSDTVFEGNTRRVFWREADDGSFLKNCTFSGNTIDKSYKTFEFGEDNKLNFENCDFGDSTFNDRARATFDGAAGVGSIFGEGSFTTVLLLISLVTSIASMGVTMANNKKKETSATVNSADESDEKSSESKA